MQSQRDRVRVVLGELELVGGVELRVELDRLDRRSGEPESLRAVAVATGALDLQRAREAVRVVLERDDAADGARGGVGQHEPALDHAR